MYIERNHLHGTISKFPYLQGSGCRNAEAVSGQNSAVWVFQSSHSVYGGLNMKELWIVLYKNCKQQGISCHNNTYKVIISVMKMLNLYKLPTMYIKNIRLCLLLRVTWGKSYIVTDNQFELIRQSIELLTPHIHKVDRGVLWKHHISYSFSVWFVSFTILSCIKLLYCKMFRSWDSAVGITTGYGLDNWGVRVQELIG